jgi:hypothetical protein
LFSSRLTWEFSLIVSIIPNNWELGCFPRKRCYSTFVKLSRVPDVLVLTLKKSLVTERLDFIYLLIRRPTVQVKKVLELL